MTHDANPTEILHTILENIAYKKESNDVTVNRYTNGTTNTALIQESSDGLISGIEVIIPSRTETTTQRY